MIGDEILSKIETVNNSVFFVCHSPKIKFVERLKEIAITRIEQPSIFIPQKMPLIEPPIEAEAFLGVKWDKR